MQTALMTSGMSCKSYFMYYSVLEFRICIGKQCRNFSGEIFAFVGWMWVTAWACYYNILSTEK